MINRQAPKTQAVGIERPQTVLTGTHITVGGKRLEASWHGPPPDQAPTLVFLHEWNLEHVLPAIRVPLLAVQGENDPYGSMAQLQTIVQRSGGKTHCLILPHCGHSPHSQCRQATFEAMKAFVLKLLSQP